MAPGAAWPRMVLGHVAHEEAVAHQVIVARGGRRVRRPSHEEAVAPRAWVECAGRHTRPPREGALIIYPLSAPLYAQGACLRALSLSSKRPTGGARAKGPGVGSGVESTACIDHTVDYDPFIKSQLASH